MLLITILTLNCQSVKLQSVVSQDVEKRAQGLLSQMTLDEKLSYIGGDNDFYIREIKRLGIPAIKMSDGPQGLRNDGKSNAMPCGIMLASTWNKDLAMAYGKALGEDAKARGVHILLGPGVNIYRAPMCGRNFEYFGEDPYLTSRTAVAYIRGVQSEGVMATVKHFAGNNQEWDRNKVSSDIDERTMQEIYLPAFAAAVKEANVGAVMSSYNLLNRVYTSQNRWLLTDILRKQWGFQGILMSDWIATYNTVEATNNGLDLEMPSARFMSVDSLKRHIATGEIQEKTINEKVLRILRTIINFGFVDKMQLDETIQLDNPKGAATALNVAREGVVLLKNDHQILPITNTKIKKIVVCGSNASQFVSGGGSGRLNPFHFVSTLDGIRKIAAEFGIQVSYVNEYSTLKFIEADLIIACFGFNSSTEKEGSDRTFELPTSETDLINAAFLSGKPVIGVVNAGGSVEMQEWFPKLSGLLWAWYPGQEGGTAIAEVLFGKVNPSGKLPVTFEKSWNDNPAFNSYYDTNKSKRVSYSEGIFVGYRGYDKQKTVVQFPFGYGLSYTKFKLTDMTVEKSKKSNEKVIITCKIQNIGTLEGAEVVQLYISKPGFDVVQPEKELKGFEKFHLNPGDIRVVTFEVSKQDLSFYDAKSQMFVAEKGKFIFMLGASSRDIVLQKQLVLE